MKGNVFNDAKCDISTTGPARSGNGMGYICEFDPSRGKKTRPQKYKPGQLFKTQPIVNPLSLTNSQFFERILTLV